MPRTSPIVLRVGAACLLVVAAGCVRTIEQHESRVGDIERDCVVAIPEGIRELGAPVSIELADASLWIWESLLRTDGSTIANPVARISRSRELCSAPDLARDQDGDVQSLLVLSADELAENATRSDGTKTVLSPTGGFAADGRAYLYYEHAVIGPGVFERESLGTGLCVLDLASAGPCERVAVSGTTILWRPERRVLNRGGLVVEDRALIAGCREVGAFDEPCTITGVPLADVRDPAAYHVWNAFEGWVDSMTNASEMTNTIGSLTIAPFADQYIATQLEVFDNRVVVQVSDRAEQSYEHRVHAFDVLPPEGDWFVSGGREHAGLREDPLSIVVTYATTNAAAPGLHLVDFRFFGAPE